MRSLLVSGLSDAAMIPVTLANRFSSDQGPDGRMNRPLNVPANARLTTATDLATANLLMEATICPELLAGDYLRKAVILLLTAKSAGRLKMPIDPGQKSGLTNLATGDINFSEPFLSCRSPLCENKPTAP